MRALAVDAQAVERRGMGGGEIAVGTAAGRCVCQFETNLGGQRFGVFVKRSASVALLVRRTVQSADHLDAHAFGPRFQVEDFGDVFVGIRDGGNTEVDFGVGFLGDDVRASTAPDDA